MMRSALSSLLLVAAFGCSRGAEAPAAAPRVEQPAPAAAPAPVAPVAAAPGDVALPAPNEVPAFLRGAPAQAQPTPGVSAEVPGRGNDMAEAFADDSEAAVDAVALARMAESGSGATRDSSLAELMKGVSVGDHEDGESWAFIGGGDGAASEDPRARVEGAAPAGDKAATQPDPKATGDAAEAATETPEAAAPEPTGDKCEPIRRALARQKDYLHRVAAERDRYGYIESASDVGALRLLESLRRCESNPDDADCKTPKVEVDITELEVPSHQIERDPSELNAEGKSPDEIPHDRITLELLHQLKACEREQVMQPLLQR